MPRLLAAGDARRVELRVDLRQQPRQSGLVLGLGAGDQHVLGVRCAQQPPAVGRVDAGAVGAVDVGAFGRQPVEHFVDDANLRVSSTWKRISGVLTIFGIASLSSVSDLPDILTAPISRTAA